MQRASDLSLSALTNTKTNKTSMNKLTFAVLTAGLLSLTGCQTFKNLTGGDDEGAVAYADKSAERYYEDALKAMNKGQYIYASEQLSELRTFYPTGPYAEQALLDLMFSQFQSKEYELAATSAEQFIKLYPRNIQVDYAYYVRGVANMHAGSSTIFNLTGEEEAHRDLSYQRLAFSNFQDLISRFPESKYTPDAAQRMTYIYNQFAESELHTARWYIKREAYVAAANRARWVFQYYPLSQQTPEAIAILAFSNDQLGLNDLAQEYKTLLQINYPEWLDSNGRVRLDTNVKSSLLNKLTFGKLGRADTRDNSEGTTIGRYTGPTKQQVIQQAAQLQLPDQERSQSSLPTIQTQRRGINLGLGLPDDVEAQQQPVTPQRTRRIVSPTDMYPEDRVTLETPENEAE